MSDWTFAIILAIVFGIFPLILILIVGMRVASWPRPQISRWCEKLNVPKEKVRIYTRLIAKGDEIKGLRWGWCGNLILMAEGWKHVDFMGTDDELIFISYISKNPDMGADREEQIKGGILRIPVSEINSAKYGESGLGFQLFGWKPYIYDIRYGAEGKGLRFFARCMYVLENAIGLKDYLTNLRTGD
jgi:hypothetical protein